MVFHSCASVGCSMRLTAGAFVVVSLLGSSGCGTVDEVDRWDREQQRAYVERPELLEERIPRNAAYVIAVPLGVDWRDVALSAITSLRLEEGAAVRRDSSLPDAPEGIVLSLGELTLGDRATVGTLYALGQQGATLGQEAKVVTYLRASAPWKAAASASLGWGALRARGGAFDIFTGPLPMQSAAANPGIRLENSEAELEPASYAQVEVKQGGRLRLRRGQYLFSDLLIREGGVLELDNTGGEVHVWVRKHLDLRGRVEELALTPTVLVGYVGTDRLELRAALHATLVAPEAEVHLFETASPHRGAIFAQTIVLHEHATMEHRRFELPIENLGRRTAEQVCERCALYAERAVAECSASKRRAKLERERLLRACQSLEARDSWGCDQLPTEPVGSSCLSFAARAFDSCQEDDNLRPGACVRLGLGWAAHW